MIISVANQVLEYQKILEDVQVTATGCSFHNCTIRGQLDVDESLALENTIVNNPDGDDIDIASGKAVTAKNNCFKSSAVAGSGTYSDIAGTSLWNTDPLFIDPDNNNFRLKASSPCRNRGDNGVWAGQASIFDYEGNPITNADGDIVAVNGTVDIGALECQFLDRQIRDVLYEATQVDFLLELDFDGYILRIAERDIAVPYWDGNDPFFRGLVLTINYPSTSFNLSSMSFAIGQISVTMANTMRLQDQECVRRLDRGIGRLYAWAAGLDWFQVKRQGLLFQGVFEAGNYNKKTYAFTLVDYAGKRLKRLPGVTINTDTWPNHRAEGGGGSVAGKVVNLVMGDWPRGVPLQCVDTTNYKYACHIGAAKSVDADYTATTENVYDKDGSVIAAGGYTFYPEGVDGQGNIVPYFDFTGDQVASEPLSCSVRALADGGAGYYTGTADALIEHPAHMVHYLLDRYSIGLSELDLMTIKRMAVLLQMNFAVLVNQAADAIDVVDRILSQCLCARIPRPDGIGIMTFDTEGLDLARITDRDVIALPTFSKTPASMICNNLEVFYAVNPATGEYEGRLYRNHSNDATCERSYYQYGEQPQRELRLPDVQEETTAIACTDRHLAIHAFRHDIVSFPAPYNLFDIIEGDPALLTLEDGPSRDGTGWNQEKCLLLDRRFTKKTITQRWWRVAVD